MKPQKHYIQVWIESEDDLPEDEGLNVDRSEL